MTGARHDEFAGVAAEYVLGLLDEISRVRFEAHLRTCAECRNELQALRVVMPAIGAAMEPIAPPVDVKARVLAHATAQGPRPQASAFAKATADGPRPTPQASSPKPQASPLPWLAAAAGIVLALGLGIYAWQMHAALTESRQVVAAATTRVEDLREQVRTLRGNVLHATRRADVVTAADVVRVTLAATKPESRAAGRAYVSPSHGVWFEANALPPLASGRIYQLWLVVPKQAPISAGLMAVNASGSGALLATMPANVTLPASVTVALTEEPANGSPGPTTPILLAGRSE